MAALLVAHHRPGFYFRVLQEGEVGAGDDIVKLTVESESVWPTLTPCCRESLRRGRDEWAGRVQPALTLSTKKEAEYIVNTVISCIEHTLLNNLGTDGFTMKLNSFGKFSVRHKPGILRKTPFTGETRLTKTRRKVRFISLGMVRQLEPVD
jgi:nucleoid DNA-binding protein